MKRIEIPEVKPVRKAQRSKQWASMVLHDLGDLITNVSYAIYAAPKFYNQTPKTGGMSFTREIAKLQDAIRIMKEVERADVDFGRSDGTVGVDVQKRAKYSEVAQSARKRLVERTARIAATLTKLKQDVPSSALFGEAQMDSEMHQRLWNTLTDAEDCARSLVQMLEM